MKIGVIGGNGFIGQWVVHSLQNHGHGVVVLGRSPRPAELPAAAGYIQGEYGNQEVLASIIAETDAIVHLAYATVPSTSFSDPIFDLMANVPSSVALFQAAAAAGAKRVVFVSSGGTVYGNSASMPISENFPTNPVSPYGITKLTVERYAHMYHDLMGLPVITIRPGNAYGVRRSGKPGGGFVSAAVNAAVNRIPVRIFGDGSTIRDYVHVRDVAEGIVSGLDHGVPGETYNVGTGIGLSNLDVVTRVRSVMGLGVGDIDVEHLPFRGFDVRANVLDCARLRTISGWTPAISIEAGIEDLRQAYCRVDSDGP